MATNKLQLPTGYEGAQRGVERQRKLADILMEQYLAGSQNTQMRSWAQPLAALAQAYMSSRVGKKADAAEQDYMNRMREDYTNRYSNFQADAMAGTSNQGMLAKYGTDPFLQEHLEPYQQALAARLKDQQELVRDGNRWVTKEMIEPGSLVSNDMTSNVIYDADGNAILNPIAIEAAKAAQGLQPDPSGPPPVTSMADPRAAPGTYELPYKEVDGQRFWKINGKWYDNPEGI